MQARGWKNVLNAPLETPGRAPRMIGSGGAEAVTEASADRRGMELERGQISNLPPF